MFGYCPGGYARILERLADRMRREGVGLTCADAARRVAALPGRRVSVLFASGREESFDEVIVTAPAPVAARLCHGLTAGEVRRLLAIRYQGLVCASLLLDEPLAGYYVTNILDPWVPFTAVIEMSALVDRAEFNGHSLVYLPKYVAPGDPVFHMPADELRRRFLAALSRMYPRFRSSAVRAFRLSRAKYVLPVSTLNYSETLPPMTTSVPGVSIVNSAHIVNGTLNVNETILLAERAANHLLKAAGVGNDSTAPSRPGGVQAEARGELPCAARA
jgi:protoporphyrinogen oxidase